MADRDAFDTALAEVESARDDGDSIGGIAEIIVENAPAGLGSPVFGKLESALGAAILSIPAVKSFEIGEGTALSKKRGSEANDPFSTDSDGKIRTERNANGGILGGISTGEPIWFRAAIKPTSSISKTQKTVNIAGNPVEIEVRGRHDPILVPRAIPVLEAMTACTILDHAMMHATQNFFVKF